MIMGLKIFDEYYNRLKNWEEIFSVALKLL